MLINIGDGISNQSRLGGRLMPKNILRAEFERRFHQLTCAGMCYWIFHNSLVMGY